MMRICIHIFYTNGNIETICC